MKALTAALLVGLLVATATPLVADGASPTTIAKRALNAAKKANTTAKDAKGEASEALHATGQTETRLRNVELDAAEAARMANEARRQVATGVGTFTDGELVTAARTDDVPRNVTRTLSVECPSGTRPVSVGFRLIDGIVSGFVTAEVIAQRLTAHGVEIDVDNSRKSTPVQVEVAANCAPSSTP